MLSMYCEMVLYKGISVIHSVATVIYWYCILLIGRPEALFVYIQFLDNVLQRIAFPFSIDKALV